MYGLDFQPVFCFIGNFASYTIKSLRLDVQKYFRSKDASDTKNCLVSARRMSLFTAWHLVELRVEGVEVLAI